MPVEALGPVGSRVWLDEGASHHALHVLRLPRDAALVLFDGSGMQARGRLVDVRDGRAEVEVLEHAVRAAPKWPLHVVLAITKGPAMDVAMRAVTEAGATDVHPVLTARSVARGERTDRWERIVLSAAQQCGRADVPRVHAVVGLLGCLDALPGEVELRIAVPGAERLPQALGPAAVCVGPEGGFTPAEVQACLDRGARPMGLGAWVLRADTAAAVATALTAP